MTLDRKPTLNVMQVPPPDPELGRLEPLVGDWLVEGDTLESLAGPAGPVRSHETFRWLDGRYFLVHEYETRFGDAAPQTGVMYWGYDSSTGRFLTHFFSNNGPYSEDESRYIGEVTGVFTGPARFRLKLAPDGSVAVSPEGTFDVEWELKDADGSWRPWMHDTYRKVS